MRALLQLFLCLFIWVNALAQAPVISVSPDSLSEDLLSGKISEQLLTIYNNGGSDLTFEINVKNDLESLLLNSIGNYSIVSSTQPLEVMDVLLRDHKSYSGRNSTLIETSLFEKNEKFFEENSFAGGLKLLLITSRTSPDEIKNALLSFPDIQQVDVFNAYTVTPTLNQLLPYPTVIVMNGYPFSDPVTLGNVLADYIDLGRGLIMTVASFAQGWEIKGRLLEDDYFPFNVGYGPAGSASLGTFNPDHPIMYGVTNATGDLLADLTIAEGAELIASWNTGWPFVATKGRNVAGVNIYVPESGFWTGDIPLILHNASFWVGSCRWLSAEPDSGTIPAGSSLNITMKFDAAGLTGGEYNSDITIISNDLVTPELIVPAHLSVTDAPAIWVQTDEIDFGEVFLGVTDTFYLEVKNIGSQDLLIFNATIQPSEYKVSPTFAGIDPGENEIFTVTFNPTVVGTYPGTLALSSNDPLYDNYLINISGQGVEPPVIIVHPDSLVVGVLPGSTRTKILTLSNEGGSNLCFNIVGGFSSTNYALQFDGVDDYIQVADHVSLNMFNSSVSISVWIKSSSNYSGETLIFEHDVWSNPATYQLTSMNSNTLRFNFPSMEWTEGALDYYVDYTDGNWHHVVGMLDTDDNEARIYYDGNLVASKSVFSEIGSATALTYIGSRGGNEMFFDGIVDEVRLWNTARSQSEIQEYMYKQLTGTEPGLVAYWQFDEGVGNIAFDKTINENHGTLFGGVQWTDDSAPLQPGWLQITTDSGFCLPNTSMDIELFFDATEVDTGDYYASVIVKSNDPINPSILVPIHMIVSSTVGIEDGLNTPLTFNLYQNYPNPFNPSTLIKYSISKTSKVKLTLFNLLGEEVTTLVNEEKNKGIYSVEFNASALPSGVYFYQLRADNYVEAKKLILLR